MSRKRSWIAGLLVAALGCGEEAIAPPAPPPVLMVPVELHDIEDRIEATGELLARSQARVAAEVAGRITRIRIDEGEAAGNGSVVLEIDPERRKLDVASARAGLTEAEAALGEAERDYGRIRKLHERATVSDSRLDQARTANEQAASRRDAARAQLGVAERALRDANVAAPFAGLIANRLVSRGEYVNVGAPLFELVALDPVEVRFHLSERDSGRVQLGDPVRVSVAPFPGESFEAIVTVVSPTIDSRTRTLAVKASLPNPGGRLRPGLFARVDLGVDLRSDVLMIPEEAVLQRSDGAVVFRLDGDDSVQRRVIELGVIREGLVEVVSGIAGDDWIVARGHTQLMDGARITPRDADGKAIPATGVAAANDAEARP